MNGLEGRAQGGARQDAQLVGQAIRAIGQIPAEQFVGALSAQGDGGFRFAELGQKPYGERSGVRAWFVRIVGKFLNRAAQILGGRQIQFVVVGPVLLHGAMNVLRFVKAAPAKGNGECF